jgi:hypothetical protein
MSDLNPFEPIEHENEPSFSTFRLPAHGAETMISQLVNLFFKKSIIRQTENYAIKQKKVIIGH